MRRILPTATFIAAVALLAAGCGGSTALPAGGGGGSSPAGADNSSSQRPPTPNTTHSSHSASTGGGGGGQQTSAPARVRHRCHTGQLAPGIEVRGVAAGHRYANIVLTNVSKTTCTVYGFGGMQLYKGSAKVPTDLVRSTKQHQPRTNVVRPGDSVYSPIRWTTVPHGNESAGSTCEPVATSARVTPPDERANKTVQWKYGPVCGHGHIVQGPYLGKRTTQHPV